jgi:hypothetical protein
VRHRPNAQLIVWRRHLDLEAKRVGTTVRHGAWTNQGSERPTAGEKHRAIALLPNAERFHGDRHRTSTMLARPTAGEGTVRGPRRVRCLVLILETSEPDDGAAQPTDGAFIVEQIERGRR